MKTRMMAVMLLVMQTSAWAQAPAVEGGTEGGNGGDPVAAEVSRTFLKVLDHLRLTPDLYPTISRVDAERIVLRLRVNIHAGATVLCNIEGERRDVVACNYPARNEIDVAADGWRGTSESDGSRFGLVAHELLGLLGLRDEGYATSTAIRQSYASKVFLAFWGTYRERVNGETSVRIRVIGEHVYVWVSGNVFRGREVRAQLNWETGELEARGFTPRRAVWDPSVLVRFILGRDPGYLYVMTDLPGRTITSTVRRSNNSANERQ